MKRFAGLVLLIMGLSLLVISMLVTVRRLHPADSQWILFHSDKADGNFDIYQVWRDGRREIRLTTSSDTEVDAVWSPNNRWKMLIREQVPYHFEDDKPLETASSGQNATPAFSPDGRWIVFVSYRDGNENLYKIPAAGGSAEQLTTSYGSDNQPTWSADGEWIWFASGRDLDWELYRMRPDGSDQQRMTESPGLDGAPHIHGEWIVFMRFHDGQYDLYKMRLDGSDLQNLTNTPHLDEQFPAWSGGGGWIVYTRLDDNNQSQIYRMSVDGGDVRRITDNDALHGSPSWSPMPTEAWSGLQIGLALVILVAGLTVRRTYNENEMVVS
jgi:TolB protein